MSEIDTEVVRRLVTGRKNDGRAVYDPHAKAEVVRACLKPGLSVARMALQHSGDSYRCLTVKGTTMHDFINTIKNITGVLI